jgi:hypothetical protein
MLASRTAPPHNAIDVVKEQSLDGLCISASVAIRRELL